MPLAMAYRAGVFDDFTASLTGRAGLLHGKKALPHLHYALAVAGVARFGAGARFGTAALAGGGTAYRHGPGTLRLCR